MVRTGLSLPLLSPLCHCHLSVPPNHVCLCASVSSLCLVSLSLMCCFLSVRVPVSLWYLHHFLRVTMSHSVPLSLGVPMDLQVSCSSVHSLPCSLCIPGFCTVPSRSCHLSQGCQALLRSWLREGLSSGVMGSSTGPFSPMGFFWFLQNTVCLKATRVSLPTPTPRQECG